MRNAALSNEFPHGVNNWSYLVLHVQVRFNRECLQPMLISRRHLNQCIVKVCGISYDCYFLERLECGGSLGLGIVGWTQWCAQGIYCQGLWLIVKNHVCLGCLVLSFSIAVSNLQVSSSGLPKQTLLSRDGCTYCSISHPSFHFLSPIATQSSTAWPLRSHLYLAFQTSGRYLTSWTQCRVPMSPGSRWCGRWCMRLAGSSGTLWSSSSPSS